jgi:hypothetical protein
MLNSKNIMMKIISKIKRYALVIASVSLLFTGCSEDALDGINKNVNNAEDVQAKFILADVITRTASNNSGGDINTYTSVYVEHEAGAYNQMYYAETRDNEPSSATTFNNPWGSLYTTLKDAKLVISKCSAGGSEAGNNVTKGMGEVMAAYNLAILTDMFGDTPWKESGDYAKYINPKIDKQAVIYTDIMAYIDAAIADLQKTDVNGPGDYDLLYGGDKTKWLKFAYGLKARYTMRLIKLSSNKPADYQKVIDNVNLSFASASEQAAFNIYTTTNINPTFDFQYSRDGLAASRSMVDKLIARNDPRLRREFVTAYTSAGKVKQIGSVTTGDATYDLMAPNGTLEQLQYYYNQSIFGFAQTAPTLLLSYHEILFLKAEAMARLGNSAVAIQPVLNSAVSAAIANTELSVSSVIAQTVITPTAPITSTEVDTYLTTNVLPLLIANPLKEVMNQKYIAFFGASGESIEAYNDIRRLKALGENLIPLANTKPFPLRLPYGNDDTTTNPEVKVAYGDGTYVYSVPVPWAGGAR